MGSYFRVPADNRDLNYNVYFAEGQETLSHEEDYHSHNTRPPRRGRHGPGIAEARLRAAGARDVAAARPRHGRAGMKVMTILGTRPEIIRLSRIIPLLDGSLDHVLVHTGQNFDERLSAVFFDELGVRQPDAFMGVRAATAVGTDRADPREDRGAPARTPARPAADSRRHQQWHVGHRRPPPRHTRVSHGSGQPLLRRPRPRGSEPARDRSLQFRAHALHRAQPCQPAA